MSPFPEAAELPPQTFQTVYEALSRRSPAVRTIRTSMEITAGAGVRGRQIIQAAMFVQQPGFLRIRGSQNEGTLFDLLVNRNTVQMLIFPEQKFYRGDVQQLEQNPQLLAGIQARDLMNQFSVEQTLVAKMQTMQYPLETEKDHYVVRFSQEGGYSEAYYLRKQDLLVDRYERSLGNDVVSRIKYWSYQYFSGNYLFPSDFTFEISEGRGQFAVKTNSVDVNQPASAELAQMSVPDGFERMALGRY